MGIGAAIAVLLLLSLGKFLYSYHQKQAVKAKTPSQSELISDTNPPEYPIDRKKVVSDSSQDPYTSPGDRESYVIPMQEMSPPTPPEPNELPAQRPVTPTELPADASRRRVMN